MTLTEKIKRDEPRTCKTTLEALYDDNFNIYKAFSTSEEKLYLSYVSSDNEGASHLHFYFENKKIFPNLIEESDIINKTNRNFQKRSCVR